jgi:hypothetical protein
MLALMAVLLQSVCLSSGSGHSGSGGELSRRMNTFSVALVGGFPIPVYGLTVFVPADSTEDPCWIVTLSGFKDMWASPPIALSVGMAFNILIDETFLVRPTVCVGDIGITRDFGQSYGVATLHVGLWAEKAISGSVWVVAEAEKRFDIAYRYYSPWGVCVGIRVNLER